MMEYIDARGWRYRVMQGLDGSWKGRYRKPDAPGKPRRDNVGWRGMLSLQYRKRRDDAEHDLAEYAKRKGMQVYRRELAK